MIYEYVYSNVYKYIFSEYATEDSYISDIWTSHILIKKINIRDLSLVTVIYNVLYIECDR